MFRKDFEYYQKSGVNASKSQLKELIKLYADLSYKLKSENTPELDSVKQKIKTAFPREIYFTFLDEKESFVELKLTESSKEYIIPIFTDIDEYNEGLEKISRLFLDKLSMKVITPDELINLAENDSCFRGFSINMHSQNFMMDINFDF